MRFLSVALGAAAWLAAALFGAGARADGVKIGATLSLTGPAASIGIPIKKAFQALPATLDGTPVSWTILDDASDTTAARRNAEKLADEGVDVIIGGNTTPTALATVEVAGSSKTPVLAIAPSPSIIEPAQGARTWMFKVPLGERELTEATLRAMQKNGVKALGVIGFNDALGDGWLKEIERVAPAHQVEITEKERFARTDSSVLAQALKILAAKPDAVFIAATSTPAALPAAALRGRGYKGPIYGTSGMLNADFIRVGGKAVEGVVVAGGPIIVVDSLDDGNPTKAPGEALTKLYQAAYKNEPVSLFAGNAYDAWLLIENAAKPALAKAKPGTPEFRAALRDALEATQGLAVTNGVVNMSKDNHGFYSADTPVLLEVKHGAWALAR